MAGNADVKDNGFTLKREALSSRPLAKLLSVVLPADQWSSERPLPHALRNVLWDRRDLAKTLHSLGVDDVASEVLGKADGMADATPRRGPHSRSTERSPRRRWSRPWRTLASQT
jgi:hypothetical protein